MRLLAKFSCDYAVNILRTGDADASICCSLPCEPGLVSRLNLVMREICWPRFVRELVTMGPVRIVGMLKLVILLVIRRLVMH